MKTHLFSAALALCTLVACEPSAPSTQSIQGAITVTGATSDALAGFAITLLPTGGQRTGVGTAMTNALGNFVFPAVERGNYVAQITLPQTVEGSRAIEVTVADTAVTLPPLAFRGLGTITGTIGVAAGSLPRATVFTGGQASTTSDSSGAFTIENVPTGQQLVVATAPGFAAAVSAPVDVVWRGNSAIPLLELHLNGSTQLLSGRVSWPGPVPQKVPPIRVVVDDNKWLGSADEDGFFSIPGVTEGVHSVDFFEMTTPKSGEPMPLHNRLPRVFVSSGQAFSIGDVIAPLPTIPLYRGRRISDASYFHATWTGDNEWFLRQGEARWTLVSREGVEVPLDLGASCVLVETGAICVWRALYNAPLATVTFTSFAGKRIVLSDRSIWNVLPPKSSHVLLAEPGASASEAVLKIVDFQGASTTLPLETKVPEVVRFSPTAHRVLLREKYQSGDTRVYDLPSGALIASDACSGGLFAGERAFCGASQLIELTAVGANRRFGSSYFQLDSGSPDGKFLVVWTGSWGEGTQTLVRTSDGKAIWSRLGKATFRWSADGKRAWGFLSHSDGPDPHPQDNELIEVNLESEAARSVVMAVSCASNDAEPSIWLCGSPDPLFAIDAAAGTRKTIADSPSGGIARYVPGGIIVNVKHRAHFIALPSLEPSTVAEQATVSEAYDRPTKNNDFVDAAGRRIAFIHGEADWNDDTIRVVDRALQRDFWIGAIGSQYTVDLHFLDANTLSTVRTAPTTALADLSGIYITEFVP